MKMKRVIQVMIVLAAAVTIGIIAGCEISVDQLPPAPVTYSISGTLIDAKVDPEDEDATAEIEGAALTLTDSEGTEAGTAETGEDGTFTFTGLDSGDYAINAVLDTYAFIEKEVTVKGEDVTGVNMLGFPAPAESTTISIFTVWSDDYADVDAMLSYPKNYYGGDNPPVLSDPYAEPPTNNGYTYPNPGGSDAREVVYWYNPGSENDLYDLLWEETDTNTPAVQLDRDDRDGSGPETITIEVIPFDYFTTGPNRTTTGDSSNMLTTGETYSWVGSMEFFVDSFAESGVTSDDSTLATEGEAGGAEVTIYVTQGSEVKGRYTIPDYTTIDTAAVLRINMLVYDDADKDGEETELFQIVPDLEIVPPGIGIKGIGNEAGILLLEGKTR
ncbi:MAG: carboxypeptidase-like regulatory domain-containing protein [Spirochaetia bacterium]